STSDKGERVIDDVIDPVQLAPGRAIRRKHVNDVAKAAQEHVTLKIEAIELRTKLREVTAVRHFELDRRDGSTCSRIPHLRSCAESLQGLGVMLGDRVD